MDRRLFLKRLAGTAAYAAPLVVAVGARAEEKSALERAKSFLKEAQGLVARAKDSAQRQTRRELAMDAEAEMTEVRKALRSATKAEQESLAKACEAVDRDIESILDD